MQKGNRRFIVKGKTVCDRQQQVVDTPCHDRIEACETAKFRNILCKTP